MMMMMMMIIIIIIIIIIIHVNTVSSEKRSVGWIMMQYSRSGG